MKALEVMVGIAIGLVTMVILVGGAAFAFGSIGRLMKSKAM